MTDTNSLSHSKWNCKYHNLTHITFPDGLKVIEKKHFPGVITYHLWLLMTV